MKKMTCKELGGACDKVFIAESFKEMAEQSRKHGSEMFKLNDKPHLQAMEEIKELMKTPEAMQNWMAEKERLFDALPNE